MGEKVKKILLTGGGTAGHVTLNLSLIPLFLRDGWDVSYIGSKNGMEKNLVAKFKEVKYFPIQTGKLRRYFSLQNFLDALKVPIGIVQAYFLVRKLNPDIIFSKGGFVSFPVVLAGWLNNKKVFMHESDYSPGLANKMSLPFVSTFFTTFEETANYIKQKSRVEYVGPVISDRLKNGSRNKGLQFAALNGNKPIIFVTGGSLGAININNAVRSNLDWLLEKYHIIHSCGKGKIDNTIDRAGYKQFEYIDAELADVFAASDIVISRAGANAIFELLSLKKPMILVPLPTAASRGEQSLNAESFRLRGFCEVIKDENLSDIDNFRNTIDLVHENRQKYAKNMENSTVKITNDATLFEKLKIGS